jgi:hypothetical protein
LIRNASFQRCRLAPEISVTLDAIGERLHKIVFKASQRVVDNNWV